MKQLFRTNLLHCASGVKINRVPTGKSGLILQAHSPASGLSKPFSISKVKMGKTALLIIAAGSEELEAIATVDTLRRAGVTVTVAGLEGAQPVVCSRNVTIVPDAAFGSVKGNVFDAVILPGGLKGSESFAKSADVGNLLKTQESKGGLIAAICAAPTALKAHKIALGKSLTSYPSTKDTMTEGNQYTYKEDRVVVDGALITSRGPGTAVEFALAISEYLVGKEKAAEVAKGLLVK